MPESMGQEPISALLVIDIQNDYFPGGAMELEGAEAAGAKASHALSFFRKKQMPVIHVRHLSMRPGSTFFLPGTKGAEIHPSVLPRGEETIVEKNFPNSFRGTPLQKRLEELNVKNLVVAGMMTHMCVDASRAPGRRPRLQGHAARRRLRDARAELRRRIRAGAPGARRFPCRAERLLRKGDPRR